MKVKIWLVASFLTFTAIAVVMQRLNLLVYASAAGNVPIARLALALGASPNTLSAHNDELALVVAAMGHHPNIVTLLLNAGANPNKSNGAMSPLIAAVLVDDRDCARLLLAHGADPNSRYKDGSPVLNCVSSPPDSELIALLKRAGARG